MVSVIVTLIRQRQVSFQRDAFEFQRAFVNAQLLSLLGGSGRALRRQGHSQELAMLRQSHARLLQQDRELDIYSDV